jgi:hypothetical protein
LTAKGSGVTRRAGRLVLAPAMALAILLGASSAPTSAAVAGPNGAAASTSISCSMALMTLSVHIATERGFSRQSVAFRLYVQPTSGSGAWTAWRPATAPFSATSSTYMSPAHFTVYVQYAWFNGSSWNRRGEWIKGYRQSGVGAPVWGGGTTTWTSTVCAT